MSDSGVAGAGQDDDTSALGAAANAIQQTVTHYEGLLELRRRHLAHAAAILDPAVRSSTVADVLNGYAADIEAYASAVAVHVNAFQGAADAVSRHDVETAWRDTDPQRCADARHIQIDRLKMARTAMDLLGHAVHAVVLDEPPPSAARHALRVYAAVFDRYASALMLVEQMALDALERIGVDAASTSARR